ncbi:MAG: hypothetical protein KF745_07030 [Phycisphaeraceae bacterium]|nr:hypothetical protein [Phycisphaeraceae bacterium]
MKSGPPLTAVADTTVPAVSAPGDKPRANEPVGGVTLRSRARAWYRTARGIVADEHVGEGDARATMAYSGFTSRGRLAADADADAAFGAMSVRARVEAVAASFDANGASAAAGFTDRLVVTAAGAPGSRAWVVYRLRVSGSVVGPAGDHHAAGGADLHVFIRSGDAADLEVPIDLGAQGVHRSERVPITLGEEFEVSLLASGMAAFPLGATGEAAVDGRVTLDAIEVFGRDGASVARPVVRARSGTEYRILEGEGVALRGGE